MELVTIATLHLGRSRGSQGARVPGTTVGTNDGSTDPSVLPERQPACGGFGVKGGPMAERGAEPVGGAELVEATANPASNEAAPLSVPGGRARDGSDMTAATMTKSSHENLRLRHKR